MNFVKKFLEQVDVNKLCVIYHDSCSDGSGAAYAVWKRFGDKATYIPYDYNKTEEAVNTLISNLKDKDVIFADVTFKRFQFLQVKDIANSVLVLDHHPSAYQDIGDLECCFFDMSRSGAMIAWNCLHPDTKPPMFIKYIQDGDLWTFKYPETKAFYSALNAFKFSFKDFDKLLDPVFEKNFLEEGKVLRNEYEKKVNSIVQQAVPVRFMGYDIYMVECDRDYASEVGSALAKKSGSFSLCHSYRGDVYKISARGIDVVNLSNLCSLFGGGGHPNASAFTTPTKEDFNLILETHKDTQIPTTEEINILNKKRFEHSLKSKI